jgi:S-layer homology domain
MSSPFCAENTISRIEAAAILLRRANLWSETLNSGTFDKNLIIPDVTPYWYGYAKKAIDAGLIKQKSDGSIGQNEKITKAEFAIMAGKILALNQCNIVNDVRNSFNSEFQIIDSASKKSA